MSVSETCKIPGCGKNKAQHADGENQGMIHHRFALDKDDLEFKETQSPRELRGNSQRSKGKVTDGARTLGDPVLRFVLVSKGIIKAEELEEAEKILRATGVLLQ